jgi:thiol-disulfide isomerase/thioredoxin
MQFKKGVFFVGMALCLAIFLAACGSGSTSHPDRFTIKAKLSNSKGEMIRLQVLAVDSISGLDSATIDENGMVSFDLPIAQPGFYLLGTAKDNFITLFIEKGEDIYIQADVMQLASDYQVSGSPGSELLMQLSHHTHTNYHKADSLVNIINTSQALPRYDSIKNRVDTAYQLLVEGQKKYVRDFITRNITSPASLMALYQVFGGVKMVNERENGDLFISLDKGLYAKYPGNPYVGELHARVEKLNQEKADRLAREASLDSGHVAPAFFLKNPSGVSLTLSSFKGNTLLLYFWAGWAPASQEQIPTLKYLYKKYAPKGFTILGVSLDKDRQTWENAMRENKLTWSQGTDLLEWSSPLVNDYNIETLPAFYLIDGNGSILLKRPDMQTLSAYLAKKYKF